MAIGMVAWSLARVSRGAKGLSPELARRCTVLRAPHSRNNGEHDATEMKGQDRHDAG